MSYDANVLRRANQRLEDQNRRRRDQAERLRQDVYARQPKLEQLDRRIQGTMAGLVAAALRQGGDPVQAVRSVREENQSLQRERAALLADMGLAEDSLDGKPACPLCRDSGWQGGRMCRCLQQLCAQEQIKELSKLLDLGEQSFDTFSMDYYSPAPDPQHGISPRENMDMNCSVCWNYATKFGRTSTKNLLLSGPPGLGKTFLSACIARTVSENGFSVVYDTAVNVFEQFETRRFRRDSADGLDARDETRRYLSCDLLILDYLGREMTTRLTQSSLYELVNTRLVAGRQTVISTNLSLEELEQRYDPPILSRLKGEYEFLGFFGADIRPLRKNQL